MDILSERERYVTQLSLVFTKEADHPRDMNPDLDYAVRLMKHREHVLREAKNDPDEKTSQVVGTLYITHSADDVAPFLAHEFKAVYDVTVTPPKERRFRGGVEAAQITLTLKPDL